jgi:hypothetical protein
VPRSRGKAHRIFALIVDGEPGASDNPEIADQECFPPALIHELGEDNELSEIRSEPIAADARPGKDPKQAAKLKLLAGMLGVGYDDLAQREAHRRHRRMMVLTTAAFIGIRARLSATRLPRARFSTRVPSVSRLNSVISPRSRRR